MVLSHLSKLSPSFPKIRMVHTSAGACATGARRRRRRHHRRRHDRHRRRADPDRPDRHAGDIRAALRERADFGLKAKKRLRELLDGGTVPRKHHGGFSDEARDCDRDVDGIAGPVRGLAGSQQPKPDTKRTTTCLEDLDSPSATHLQQTRGRVNPESIRGGAIELPRNPQRIRETMSWGERTASSCRYRIFVPMMGLRRLRSLRPRYQSCLASPRDVGWRRRSTCVGILWA